MSFSQWLDVTNPYTGALAAPADGKVVNDGVMTAGQFTVDSALGLFLSGDATKKIVVSGAGQNGAFLWKATIVTVNSATRVTLDIAASTSVSGAVVIWGSDNTPNLNTMMASLNVPQGNYYPQHAPYMNVTSRPSTPPARLLMLNAKFGPEIR